ncbi:MAG: hypothetical protein KDA90_14600 [Planctomycetaceae bacterium]|nr:hypothetical protein [Planctomycetaceae bacterium]
MKHFNRHIGKHQPLQNPTTRTGSIMVLSAFLLIVLLGFVALAVDISYISLTRTRMQNACDAAALAAAMEITHAVQTAGPNVADVTAYALSEARQRAAEVAALNGVYVDPNVDVEFGQRSTDPNTGAATINWGASPANVVRVSARRSAEDTTAPDGRLKLFFGPVISTNTTNLMTQAAAYVESRDIALVLDFSASMNDDSSFDNVSSLNSVERMALNDNMADIFEILASVRNLGTMSATPQWLRVSESDNIASGTVTFRDTYVDVTTSGEMSGIQLRFSDNSTQTQAASGTSGTFTRSGSSRRITRVTVTVSGKTMATQEPKTITGTTPNGRTANLTFDASDNTVRIVNTTTGENIRKVKVYYDGSNKASNSNHNTDVVEISGDNSYITRIKVRIGNGNNSSWMTIDNPFGSSSSSSGSSSSSTDLVFDDNTTNIKKFMGLTNVSYPWASGSWDDFISHCQSDSTVNNAGYRYKYGGANLVNYLLRNKYYYHYCNDLWRTPHYPFHSVKQGSLLFADFLENLGFGDEMGVVSYDVYARVEQQLDYDGYDIDISDNPVSNRFEEVRQIVRHRQAAHYLGNTNIGGGIHQAKLLLDSSARPGTRPTILVMTDGNPNVTDSGWSFPYNWDWDELFDYDGDGDGDYYTSSSAARYALVRAKEAVDAGYTIHTMTVGSGADPSLMRAIAWLGQGITIEVTGGQSVSDMEAEVMAAFNRIAAFVPPAKLVQPE